MDAVLYPDLDEDPEPALANWRHLVRSYKDHPALLMWAIGNEPNLAGSEHTFATKLDEFFRFVGKVSPCLVPSSIHRLNPFAMISLNAMAFVIKNLTIFSFPYCVL
jgi:hypothetical protein